MLYLAALGRHGARLDSGWLVDRCNEGGLEALITELKGRPVIFGGGGLMGFDGHDKHTRALEILRQYAASGGRVVLWGVGHNRTQDFSAWLQSVGSQPYGDLEGLHVGVRDFGTAWRWVPCASSLHEGFDASRPAPDVPVVAFLHGGLSVDEHDLAGIPLMKNFATKSDLKKRRTLDGVLDFLSRGEVVLTNSYHGAYWATLLGRRVIAVPNSSKFLAFRHAPAMVPELSRWRSVMGDARPYPTALRDAREANWDYFSSLRSILEPRVRGRGEPQAR